MLTLEIVFALLFGLALGSFMNVCISRLPPHRSVVKPGSHCPHCKAPIQARDNIPLLSFALLGGRCRACHRPISWRYPLVELVIAGLSVACVLIFGLWPDGAALTVYCALLVGLAACDAETLRLPDALTLPLLGMGILYRATTGFWEELHRGTGHPWHAGLALGLRGTISAVATGLALLLLRWLYWVVRHRQGMGLGDVKLAAGIAAWLGARLGLVAFFLAVVSGAVVTLLLVALRRGQAVSVPAQSTIPGQSTVPGQSTGVSGPTTPAGLAVVPFGTFLCIAAIYCVFFGMLTLHWYMHFFS
jgi:leader peptidase (prepilin peptidase) / N-methyltransferase